MQVSCNRFRTYQCLFPAGEKWQDILAAGKMQKAEMLKEMVFPHLTHVALVVEENEQTGKKRPKVVKVGMDPHFAYANMLCDVAWARNLGVSTIMLPPLSVPVDDGLAKVQETLSKAPVAPLVTVAPPGKCGSCAAFQDGLCADRGFRVGPTDAGCVGYIQREGEA